MNPFLRRGLVLATVFALVAGACGTTAVTPAPTAVTPPTAVPATAPPATAVPGASATAAPAPTPVPATPAATATATVGSADFSFVVDSEPTLLAGAPDDLPTSWIVAFIYSTLYQPDYKINYLDTPQVASAPPEISADGLTWTVKIRPGIKFHDGSDLTSADVKFSFDLVKSPNCRENPDLCSSGADNVASVDAPDPLTVVFNLKQKFAPFAVTGLGSVLIRPKAAVEASFARFQAAAGAVTKEEVKALADKVAAATAAADAAGKPTECAGETPPDSCKFATYTAELEGLLGKASIALVDKARFNTGGESGTDFDPEAYGQGLLTQVLDLDKSLNTTAIDQIAAALRLLDFGQNPIGSGPYKFVKYNAGQSVEMAAWEGYFGGTTGVDPARIPPKAFALVIRDTSAGTAALANDDIQWQPKIESDAFTTVRDNPNVQVAEYPDNGYYFIAFNLRDGHIYSDKNLRTAFTMCIDHAKTVEVATDANGVPVQANTPPFSWAYNPDVAKYTLDVPGAKALIESSGWALGGDGVYAKEGTRLSSILYVRVGRPQRLKFAQLARDQLLECGIEIDVQEADLNTVLIPKVLDYPNEFDTYLGGWSTSLDPDDYSIFHSSEIPTKDMISANNFPGWKSATADKLLEDGRTTLDQEGRKAIYAQFQTLIHDEAPYYFLWADLAHTGLSARLTSQNVPLDLTTTAINYYNQEAWTIRAR